MTSVTKVFGALGCGKTTWLQRKLEEIVDGENVTLKDVIFVSFSNAAVDELCGRISVVKGGRTALHFRTLHGLCLSFLCREDENIRRIVGKMMRYDFVEGVKAAFCAERGIPYERGDHAASENLGNRAFSAWTAVVGELYPKLRDERRCLDKLHELNEEYTAIIEEWLRFKEKTGVLDYEDMLVEAYERGIHVDAAVGFFDEAQDFNRLEFEIVKQIVDGLDDVYLAGDDESMRFTVGRQLARSPS